VGELLITLGLLLLLFVAWQLWWTDVVADAQQEQIATDLRDGWSDNRGEDTPPSEPQGDPPPVAEPEDGEAFALVHVPRFGEGYQARPVIEGTSLDLLENGVGHYDGTALPGGVGNFAVAGHRVTYGKPFNLIAELDEGDAVVVETADTWFTYRVRSSTIVTPDRVDVVAPVPEQPGAVPTERLMTLTACHPMFSARERYVVYAVLESWQPAANGPPSSLEAT
jgi:sortase A